MGIHLSAQRELSNEYQHDRVEMVFKNLCNLVIWMKVASVLEGLTLMLVVANFANTKWCKKANMTETLAHGYSSESAQQELPNEYQHDRV